MILRGATRTSSLILPCCYCNIHTSATCLTRKSNKKPKNPFFSDKWGKLADKVKGGSYYWKKWEEEAKSFKTDNYKFEKVKSQHNEDNNNNSDKNKASGFQDKIMELIPSPAKFNSFFDKGLSKLPSGPDLAMKVPPEYRPYLHLSRVDKPIGAWLLWLPGAWGICLAAPAFGFPSIPLLTLFGAGAILMRGAGCTINDMYDIDIDKKVIRTRDRPLASGQLNKQQALQWLALQLGISAIILFSLNTPTIAVGVCSLILVGTYPLAKRYTNYPQLYLGLTFNLGAVMGFTAAAGTIGFAPLALYSAGICWTMVYDTIYAHQDKNDDLRVGVKSTALKFGDRTIEMCTVFTTAMGISLFVAGIMGGMGATYFVTSYFSCLMILKGLSEVNLDNPKSCWEFFIMNKNIGLLILLGIIIGNFI